MYATMLAGASIGPRIQSISVTGASGRSVGVGLVATSVGTGGRAVDVGPSLAMGAVVALTPVGLTDGRLPHEYKEKEISAPANAQWMRRRLQVPLQGVSACTQPSSRGDCGAPGARIDDRLDNRRSGGDACLPSALAGRLPPGAPGVEPGNGDIQPLGQ